jgi:hypothetical protein
MPPDTDKDKDNYKKSKKGEERRGRKKKEHVKLLPPLIERRTTSNRDLDDDKLMHSPPIVNRNLNERYKNPIGKPGPPLESHMQEHLVDPDIFSSSNAYSNVAAQQENKRMSKSESTPNLKPIEPIDNIAQKNSPRPHSASSNTPFSSPRPDNISPVKDDAFGNLNIIKDSSAPEAPETYKFQLEFPTIQVDGTTYNAAMSKTSRESDTRVDDGDNIRITLTPNDDSKTTAPMQKMTLNLSVKEVIPTKYPDYVYKFHEPTAEGRRTRKNTKKTPESKVKIDNGSNNIVFEYTKFDSVDTQLRNFNRTPSKGSFKLGGRSRTHKLHAFKRRKTSRNKTRRMRRSAFLHKTKKNFHRR